MQHQQAATPQDVKEKLIDYRDVQNVLDVAVKKALESHNLQQEEKNIAYKAEVKALYDLVFDTNTNVKELNEKVAPIVIAWGEGKTTTKILWLILKGMAWIAAFIMAVSGAVIAIKEAIRR